ncbi:expressed unknown protein [Ectocarpus siliculosus]|uniref:Uncharacterized protein n=1 Tax=Ectocarpus siliculosus TaxID=2880 RepID=D7FWX8_ECTSI|nr:expressed unknown protein [Ectocarpus siliculosus]|eukprot:CBJ32216.1 expressed unknown protein [Ectocarpus siliculosus]
MFQNAVQCGVSNIFVDSARDASVRTPSVSQRTTARTSTLGCLDTRRSPHAVTSACASSTERWVFHSSEAPEPLLLRHNIRGGRRLPGPRGFRSSLLLCVSTE